MTLHVIVVVVFADDYLNINLPVNIQIKLDLIILV